MLVRSSIVVALLAVPAAADAPHDIPGTADDPIVALTLLPSVVDAPMFPGLSIRGGDPDDTKVFFDGFEVPVLFHDDRALRSTISSAGLQNLVDDRTDVELGHGASFIDLTPQTRAKTQVAYVSDIDVGFGTPIDRRVFRVPGYAALRVGNVYDGTTTMDGSLYIDHVHGPWKESLSELFVLDDVNGFAGRAVGRLRYEQEHWWAAAAVSPIVGPGSAGIDGRAQLSRSGRAAGLRFLQWSGGVDSKSRDVERHWINDVAAWSWLSAWLSPKIIARGGVRIDAFLRGGDFATQPRGSIEWHDESTTVKLSAGAYRRPPEKPSEIGYEYLQPERTTQVLATLQQRRSVNDRTAIGGELVGYFIDRRRLVARDSLGNWGNTGVGSSTGIELFLLGVRGRWMAFLGASLSTSARRDYPRGRERPNDFDQPVRLDSMIRYKTKRWSLATRFSLSSGLPYTPIEESTYNSDADSYAPVFAFPNSARLPWMHSLDVRADVYLGRGFRAFAELRNAYAASTALGYEYSFDYQDRLDVTLPILPFVGIARVMAVPQGRPAAPVIASDEARP